MHVLRPIYKNYAAEIIPKISMKFCIHWHISGRCCNCRK